MNAIKTIFQKFFLCGTAGWCLEILFTAFDSFRKRQLELKGSTSVWMFPIYGMAAFLLPICRLLKDKSPALRGFIYMLCIFTAEFLTGSLLKRHNLCPWDYSRAKLSVKGLIRLDFAPFWFLTGLFFERLLGVRKKRG